MTIASQVDISGRFTRDRSTKLSARQSAMELASQGFRVFPLAPLTPKRKAPLKSGWQQEATNDAFEVLNNWPEGAPVGIATGEDFTVIDADVAAGGLEGVKTLNLPRTRVIRTWSGGLHYYLKTPAGQAVASSAKKIAPGVDVRGQGGLVAAPGCRIGDRYYYVEDDAPIAELPPSIIALCGKAREREKTRSDVVRDPPGSRELGEAFIRGPAKKAQQGNRDNTATAVAMRLYDFAVSRDTCRELLDVWNETKCSPPLDDEALDRIAWSAERSKQDAIGREDPTRAFAVVEPAPNEMVVDRPRPRLFAPSAERWIGKTPEPIPFVVDRLIPRDFVTILVSAGGRGKSTLAQQLMSCVVSGKPFLGFPVIEQGAAAGAFCEDADGALQVRQSRICKGLETEFETLAPQLGITSYVNEEHELWRQGRFTHLYNELSEAIAVKGNVRLLVLDGTSHLYSGSEIDRSEVTKFLSGLTRLAAKHSMAIVLITHESKSTADNDTHASSGSTAWVNASRSVLKLNSGGDDSFRDLVHIKSNLSKKVSNIRCSFDDGFFIPLVSDARRAEECRDVAEKAIRSALEAGVRLSPNSRAGNYAPKWLEKNLPGHNFSKDELEEAIRCLMRSVLRQEEYPSGGRTAVRLALTQIPDGSRTVTVADGSGAVGEQPSGP